jgi:predicted  nucleic acid-binding Zn-ribbon protein
MTQPAIICRNLHLLHLRVHDLREEAERGPNRLKKYELKIADQEKQLHDLQEKIKHTKAEQHKKELDIKETRDKIEKHRKQMSLITNNKEYEALRKEIDNENQVIRVIEDQILEVMLRIDELNTQIPELDKALKAAKDEKAKAEVEFGGKAQELAQRLTDAQAELKAAEGSLEGDLKTMYLRLVKAHGADALSPLNGQSCAACYTDLTPQNFNDIRAGRMVICKNCGKLLYPAE